LLRSTLKRPGPTTTGTGLFSVTLLCSGGRPIADIDDAANAGVAG
jgi:hypothetical protein